ncbi:MAG: GlsB/YeaQ/YmgE family stress response membrane protein [Planctomycetota bacterium]|nr:MAG: GlsB/YeaQ/YmgE family stress response membrane protein [Planctomycetota bacterium]REJ86646.1 MAG: GlsB/YeaQ/YmgE family stress response membrane protein [Planctomycetota bacterium]REK28511.1 MAG: GlsB/YeaQ/YmgE family stress response membrane protein [Planctomycetota bacterium]REK29149.1 MAG: GlsB/YeaQ/YmgE family stress response membrane protein [Planctomycetota bacterium]
MTLLEFILLLVIAGICGGIAQALAGSSPRGCLVSIVLGFIGALLGTWLARKLGLPEILTITLAGKTFPIIWSIIGASLFAALLGLITGRGSSSRWKWRRRRFWE